MENIVNAIDNFAETYFFNIPDMKIFPDVVEILIIAYFFYKILLWVKNSSSWQQFKGLLFILAFFALAALLNMSTILWIGKELVSVALIALVVVFQPELRKALERLGRRNSKGLMSYFGFTPGSGKRFEDATIVGIVAACYEMGAVKTGALIVVENDTELTDCESTGIELDAKVTRQLLINIFEKNTPLHDGAIIVRGDKIVSATCYLPLSDSKQISKDLGTRHRAAIGISEVSDALVIVVSEETGKVSIAQDAKLYRDVTEDQLKDALRKIQLPEDLNDAAPSKTLFKKGGRYVR